MLPASTLSRSDSAFDNSPQTSNGSSFRDGSEALLSPDINGVRRPKQKRNKPTLSCAECVDRKTKVSPPRRLTLATRETMTSNNTAVRQEQA